MFLLREICSQRSSSQYIQIQYDDMSFGFGLGKTKLIKIKKFL